MTDNSNSRRFREYGYFNPKESPFEFFVSLKSNYCNSCNTKLDAMNAFDDLIRNGNKRLKRLKMVCMNLGFTLVLTILVTMTAMIDQSDNTIAQNQTTAPTSGSVTNFTRLVEDKKAAYNLSITDLGVLYESPTTLVLWGNSFDSLGEVIDIAKRNGYKIDSMTVSFQPGDYSGIIYFNEEFTIIMSKE